MVKIGVTELEYKKAKAIFLNAALSGFECLCVPKEEKELAKIIHEQGLKHVIIGVDRYVGPLYDALPPGGVIARYGVAHDGVDKNLATENKLLCTNTPGVLNVSVAEHTIALILSAARHIPKLSSDTRRGEWPLIVGEELHEKTLTIIGCGAIGCRVAQIASYGFGMKVLGCDLIAQDDRRMRKCFGFSDVRKNFLEVSQRADYLSLHIPSNPDTIHFVNKKRLSQMPKNAWLINTARGALIDHAALYDALSCGHLAGAALDVFESEPYAPGAPDKDLRSLDNVIMTPHVSSSTREACDRIAQKALHNIILAEEKKFDQMDLLNPEVCKS